MFRLAGVVALVVSSLSGRNQAGEPAFVPEGTQAAAMRYAGMTREACYAELQHRNLPWTPLEREKGILAPVRLTGPLNGITFHSPLPKKSRDTASIEIFDCRLLLAVHDFSFILAQANVVDVVHFSVYRFPGKRFPDSALGKRHGGGLAIDIGKLVRRDGTVLSVEHDFHGRIGSTTCPMGGNIGPSPATADARTLWEIFCTAAEAHLFNVALSPNYNKPHFNHFHLEVTPGVRWFIAH